MTKQNGSPAGPIYHLTPISELCAGCDARGHRPARLPEDGFVHCAGSPAVALSVALDYFADLDEALWVLEIDPRRLRSPLRFEAPAPIAGGGTRHLRQAPRFPHVYGPIDREAIVAVGRLRRTANGFAWPDRFEALAAVLPPD